MQIENYSVYSTVRPSTLFTIKECIGRGSFGDVYKAENIMNGKIVAIKMINLEQNNDDIDVLSQEIFFLAQLKSPFITHYIATLVEDTSMWIIMEYCGGGSCADLLRHCYKNGLTEEKVSFITQNVLRGLEYLHLQQKIHRDIKAANILLTNDGLVKIGDFGVSGQMNAALKKDTFVGTPYWMAPEIITSNSSGYNEKADIWSLGITVYELIKGLPPLAKHNPLKVMVSLPKRKSPRLHGSYSECIKHFISKCLNKNSEERPSTSKLLNHDFIIAYMNRVDNLKDDIIRLRQTKVNWEYNNIIPQINEMIRTEKMDNGWDFNQESVKTQGNKNNTQYEFPNSENHPQDFSPISSNVLSNKNKISSLSKDQIITPDTVISASFKKYKHCNVQQPGSNKYVPSYHNESNLTEIEQDEKNKMVTSVESKGNLNSKYEVGSGMEIDSESVTKQPGMVLDQEHINYFKDVISYCLKRLESRAVDEDTKTYVNTLLQTFSAIEGEVPGFSDFFMEEIIVRMEAVGNYIINKSE